MNILKRILKGIAYLVGVLLLIGVAQIGWGLYRDPIAKQEAMDFCASIKVGDAADGLPEKALASGAEKRSARWMDAPNGRRLMMATYTGMPPFSRHLCVVKAEATVIEAKYSYLD